jgi:hypothetical protein
MNFRLKAFSWHLPAVFDPTDLQLRGLLRSDR